MASLVDQLSASRSFYGYCAPGTQEKKGSDSNLISKTDDTVTTHETLYSLILSLLPSMDHIYEFGCSINSKDYINVGNIDACCFTILHTVLNALRLQGGWNIPKVSVLLSMV